jgi:hypothetical protein
VIGHAPRIVDEGWLRQAGEHEVDAPNVCVLTHFRLKSARHLPSTYRDFGRVLRAAQDVEGLGLLRSAILLENPTSCYIVSIWTDIDQTLVNFRSSVPVHVEARRNLLRRLSVHPDRGPEFWSTTWRLIAVSNNLNWDDFDLRGLLIAQGAAIRAK